MVLSENIKFLNLTRYLSQYKQIAVAFSGGVDSTLLLAAAQLALKNQIVAFTIRTPYIPNWEIEEAIEFTATRKIKHKIIDFPFVQKLKSNPTDRCYWCKTNIFRKLLEETQQAGMEVLMDGTNFDDLSDYRPGIKALKELNIVSPFLELHLTKADIRNFSKELGLPTYEKPAYACLLTRIPYGQEIKNGELKRIEQAELYLMELGFKGHRVRVHGDLARIEFQKNDLEKVLHIGLFHQIASKLRDLGFGYVTVDMQGYRMGSLNESL